MNPTNNLRPAFFAAPINFSAAAASPVKGFSTNKSLPSSNTRKATFRCVRVGVQTVTASKPGDLRNSSMFEKDFTPYLAPTSPSRDPSTSQTPIKSQRALCRKTLTWFSPQNPVPTTPTLTRFNPPSCPCPSKRKASPPSPHLKLPKHRSNHTTPPACSSPQPTGE